LHAARRNRPLTPGWWLVLWPDAGLRRRRLRISLPAGVDSLSVAVGQL
jgi:hypothetical protein